MPYYTAAPHWDTLMEIDESRLYHIPIELFQEEFGYDPRDED